MDFKILWNFSSKENLQDQKLLVSVVVTENHFSGDFFHQEEEDGTIPAIYGK